MRIVASGRVICHRQILVIGGTVRARRILGGPTSQRARCPTRKASGRQPPPVAVRARLSQLAVRRCRPLCGLAAMGQTISLRGVVVAYTVGQLVSVIPILPGGGGTIEATMSAGLVLAGGAGAAVIAAVLLYRIVSAWALVPLGWGLWRTMPKADRAQLEAAAA